MRSGDDTAPETMMSLEEFRVIREQITERLGLAYGDDARALLSRRLRERLVSLGLSSFTEYARQLRCDGDAEVQELHDLLATRETYFFREEYQLKAFREEVLPVLVQEGAAQKHLTLWSAGCSSGEEVYSIAIVVMESGLVDGWNVRVHGTDLSRRSLAAARKGAYGEAAFRSTSEDRKRRWFTEQEGTVHVSEQLKAMCHFGLMNLLDMQRSPRFVQIDAAFCKNVLIYFDAASRKRVLDGIYDRLRPGGYLLLGHAESLLNEVTRFQVVHLRGDVVYRKPRGSGAPPRRSASPPGRGRRRS
jgi:chemotaxis protein methyltransferase CheR